MIDNIRGPVRRKSVLVDIYTYLNGCDLAQLDAIMLAVFVLILGIGTLGSCFLLGHLQNCFAAQKMNQQQRQIPASAVYCPAAVGLSSAAFPAPSAPNSSFMSMSHSAADFGRPRYSASAFVHQAGQAAAASAY